MLWVTIIDRVALLQLADASSSIFEVEMGSSALVGSSMQQHLGLHGQGASDAQALLLAAGQAQGALLQPVLQLVPDGGRCAATALDDLVQLRASARTPWRARAVGDVVVDAHGEGVRLLEHHAHALAQVG